MFSTYLQRQHRSCPDAKSLFAYHCFCSNLPLWIVVIKFSNQKCLSNKHVYLVGSVRPHSILWEAYDRNTSTKMKAKNHGQTLFSVLCSCLVTVSCSPSSLIQPRPTFLRIHPHSEEEPSHFKCYSTWYLTNLANSHSDIGGPQWMLPQMVVGPEILAT